jgi:hypothetical protein
MFDLVLSQGSLDEVLAKGDPAYNLWALDVLDHWQIRIDEHQGQTFDGSGEKHAERLDETRLSLSAKDGRLLRHALALECDAPRRRSFESVR